MNKVLITNIKDPTRPQRSAAYDLSIASWKVWCDKNDCELLVIDEFLFSLDQMSPIYYRHYWSDMVTLNDDEQILTVDADTIIHPDCPNFFNLTNMNFSAVHNDGDYDWIIRSIENYQFEFKDEFTKKFDIFRYINSGFIISNNNFIWLHKKLLDFYWNNQNKVVSCQKRYGVGTDQPLINLITNENDVEINRLPYRFNMQELPRKGILDDRMLFTKIPGVYHFNGIEGGPDKSNYWLTKTYNYIFR